MKDTILNRDCKMVCKGCGHPEGCHKGPKKVCIEMGDSCKCHKLRSEYDFRMGIRGKIRGKYRDSEKTA